VTATSVPPEDGYTPRSLAADLRRLGLQSGDVVLVHAATRRIGRVAGGAAGVAEALADVIGTEGTLVVPTQTADNSDTSSLHLSQIAGLTPGQSRRFRARMPPFDPVTTPSTGMGHLAEQVRTSPGAIRSAHPQTSFAALGPLADKLMSGHRLDCHLGEFSPLARLYEVDARILLLGVGYDVCTAFHLAEYRYHASPPRREYRCVVSQGGRRRWRRYEDVVLDDRDFGRLGADLEQVGVAATGWVGAAECRLLPLAPAVDFAVAWLHRHRVSQ
jgi:aminoglycoside 3-N-acetyltransferase